MHHRYIVDITQLVHWSGTLTGIPRVMDELSIRFLKNYPNDTVFVSWVREIEQMCEIDFEETRKNRGGGIGYVQKNGTSIPLSTSSTQSVKTLTKKTLKKIAIKSRLDRTPMYKKAVDTKRNIEAQNYRVYTPESGDKLFIPWGEWWDARWLKLIKDYSQNSSVDVYPICHDIVPMVVPQFSGNSISLAQFVTEIFPISKAVITPSKASRKDLIKWMEKQKLTVPPVEVFRLGEDFSLLDTAKLNDSDILNKYSIEKEEYLICVSTLEPRKNHTLLYYTYKLAIEKNIKLPKLLLVGRIGHDSEPLVKFIKQDPEIKDLISICEGVDDEELNWLYSNSKFAILPSFYEGWGMSVIEAISRGKPVVCSNKSSLLEISDEYLIRFSPASTDECLNAILEMSKQKTLTEYKKRASSYTPHSWDGSFEQIISILEKK